jgi:hypothetical protein
MTAKAKCENVKPLPLRISPKVNYAMSDFGVCPDCGRWLVILGSGFFRTHQPRFKAGSHKIEEEVNRYKAEAAK